MLQECWSARSYTHMQMCIVIEEQYTGCQHSTTSVLNGWPYAIFSVLQ
jgi:hypothetical protein